MAKKYFDDIHNMEYKKPKHRYVLKTNVLKDILGITVDIKILMEGSIVSPKGLMDQLSRQTYEYYYDQKQPEDRFKAEFNLNTIRINAETLFDAMIGALEYALYGKGNLAQLQNGINVSTGNTIEVSIMREDFRVALSTTSNLRIQKLLYKDRLNYQVLADEDIRVDY